MLMFTEQEVNSALYHHTLNCKLHFKAAVIAAIFSFREIFTISALQFDCSYLTSLGEHKAPEGGCKGELLKL